MSSNKRRINKDVMKLMNSSFKVELCSEDSLSEFIVKFPGPKDTIYENGLWDIRVCLPEKYPYRSPSIGFMTKIFHPNIDRPSGSVCLDVINQTWTPLYDLMNVFDTFLPQLLAYPNASDPLNSEAAKLYLSDKGLYEMKVKEYVKKYAHVSLGKRRNTNNSGSSSSSEDTDEESTSEDQHNMPIESTSTQNQVQDNSNVQSSSNIRNIVNTESDRPIDGPLPLDLVRPQVVTIEVDRRNKKANALSPSLFSLPRCRSPLLTNRMKMNSKSSGPSPVNCILNESEERLGSGSESSDENAFVDEELSDMSEGELVIEF